MRSGSAAAAPFRHVGLVALEALLIAVIVWIATMTLAGATQSGGLVGSANAGDSSATLTVVRSANGLSATLSATPGGEGTWVHATCVQSTATVASEWIRLTSPHAVVSVARSATWPSGAATCSAEEGYFLANGRWRVIAAATFDLG